MLLRIVQKTRHVMHILELGFSFRIEADECGVYDSTSSASVAGIRSSWLLLPLIRLPVAQLITD